MPSRRWRCDHITYGDSTIRYMILELARFHNGDHRTLEDLFHQVQREVINAMMDTAIIIIVDALLNAVRKCFNATEEQMNLLLVEFIGELPESWKSRFQLPASAQMHSRG